MIRSEPVDSPSPKFSVVLVNYNTKELTLRALEALDREIGVSPFEVEVILVDNASVDGSLEGVAARFPRVILLPSEVNLGFGRGNNLGVEVASGEILLFLNTDTEIRSGALPAIAGAFDRDGTVGAVGARLENPDGSHQPSAILVPSLWRIFCEFFWLDRTGLARFSGMFQNGFDPDSEQDIEAAHGAALAVRRDLFDEIGRFDPDYFMYFEEADLCTRIAERGYRIRYTPEAVVMHHVSASSGDRPWWFFRAMRNSRMTFVRKHLSGASRILLPLLVHSGYAMRIVLFGTVGLFNSRLRSLGRQMARSYVDRSGPDRGEGRG